MGYFPEENLLFTKGDEISHKQGKVYNGLCVTWKVIDWKVQVSLFRVSWLEGKGHGPEGGIQEQLWSRLLE